MAGMDHIEITDETGKNNITYYQVLASSDLETKDRLSILDKHFFSPGELLQVADYVQQHRAKLESEAAAQWWRRPQEEGE
jgi:hypothetical protein